MNLLEPFQEFILSNHLFTKKDGLLVAVSGGVDSIVLCDLLHQSGYAFSIAHCNFQLREKESEADEAFVANIAKHYDAPFYRKKFDTTTFAAAHKLSVQLAARELRYAWFRELLDDRANHLNKLLTAHHLNDNIETLLMNFFKSTGIRGLQGIRAKSPDQTIIRPMLELSKEDILQYASAQSLSWREDASNQSNKYTRNYFRNELIPIVQKVMPQAEDNLKQNLKRFRDINTLYELSVEKITAKLRVQKGAETFVSVGALQKTPALATVLYELLKPFSFSPAQTDAVAQLLKAESGKYVLSPTHRVLRNRQWLIISSLKEEHHAFFLWEEEMPQLHFPAGVLSMDQLGNAAKIDPDPAVALLDAKQISFPLLLRKWKAGDYFYPLGMTKKKKLSRFLIDQKCSLVEKENTWVLESEKKIIWVVGRRIDNRFKLSAKTKSVLRIRLTAK
ncbi:MAG: tRNA(Ile)-lysidine synthase [Ferruginibacter sp.]|nr:tRNA(Ile)-lysidine synthase [Ferruginibacter sp.]